MVISPFWADFDNDAKIIFKNHTSSGKSDPFNDASDHHEDDFRRSWGGPVLKLIAVIRKTLWKKPSHH
jgi:hypothetical protein